MYRITVLRIPKYRGILTNTNIVIESGQAQVCFDHMSACTFESSLLYIVNCPGQTVKDCINYRKLTVENLAFLKRTNTLDSLKDILVDACNLSLDISLSKTDLTRASPSHYKGQIHENKDILELKKKLTQRMLQCLRYIKPSTKEAGQSRGC